MAKRKGWIESLKDNMGARQHQDIDDDIPFDMFNVDELKEVPSQVFGGLDTPEYDIGNGGHDELHNLLFDHVEEVEQLRIERLKIERHQPEKDEQMAEQKELQYERIDGLIAEKEEAFQTRVAELIEELPPVAAEAARKTVAEAGVGVSELEENAVQEAGAEVSGAKASVVQEAGTTAQEEASKIEESRAAEVSEQEKRNKALATEKEILEEQKNWAETAEYVSADLMRNVGKMSQMEQQLLDDGAAKFSLDDDGERIAIRGFGDDGQEGYDINKSKSQIAHFETEVQSDGTVSRFDKDNPENRIDVKFDVDGGFTIDASQFDASKLEGEEYKTSIATSEGKVEFTITDEGVAVNKVFGDMEGQLTVKTRDGQELELSGDGKMVAVEQSVAQAVDNNVDVAAQEAAVASQSVSSADENEKTGKSTDSQLRDSKAEEADVAVAEPVVAAMAAEVAPEVEQEAARVIEAVSPEAFNEAVSERLENSPELSEARKEAIKAENRESFESALQQDDGWKIEEQAINERLAETAKVRDNFESVNPGVDVNDFEEIGPKYEEMVQSRAAEEGLSSLEAQRAIFAEEVEKLGNMTANDPEREEQEKMAYVAAVAVEYAEKTTDHKFKGTPEMEADPEDVAKANGVILDKLEQYSDMDAHTAASMIYEEAEAKRNDLEGSGTATEEQIVQANNEWFVASELLDAVEEKEGLVEKQSALKEFAQSKVGQVVGYGALVGAGILGGSLAMADAPMDVADGIGGDGISSNAVQDGGDAGNVLVADDDNQKDTSAELKDTGVVESLVESVFDSSKVNIDGLEHMDFDAETMVAVQAVVDQLEVLEQYLDANPDVVKGDINNQEVRDANPELVEIMNGVQEKGGALTELIEDSGVKALIDIEGDEVSIEFQKNGITESQRDVADVFDASAESQEKIDDALEADRAARAGVLGDNLQENIVDVDGDKNIAGEGESLEGISTDGKLIVPEGSGLLDLDNARVTDMSAEELKGSAPLVGDGNPIDPNLVTEEPVASVGGDFVELAEERASVKERLADAREDGARSLDDLAEKGGLDVAQYVMQTQMTNAVQNDAVLDSAVESALKGDTPPTQEEVDAFEKWANDARGGREWEAPEVKETVTPEEQTLETGAGDKAGAEVTSLTDEQIDKFGDIAEEKGFSEAIPQIESELGRELTDKELEKVLEASREDGQASNDKAVPGFADVVGLTALGNTISDISDNISDVLGGDERETPAPVVDLSTDAEDRGSDVVVEDRGSDVENNAVIIENSYESSATTGGGFGQQDPETIEKLSDVAEKYGLPEMINAAQDEGMAVSGSDVSKIMTTMHGDFVENAKEINSMDFSDVDSFAEVKEVVEEHGVQAGMTAAGRAGIQLDADQVDELKTVATEAAKAEIHEIMEGDKRELSSASVETLQDNPNVVVDVYEEREARGADRDVGLDSSAKGVEIDESLVASLQNVKEMVGDEASSAVINEDRANARSSSRV